MGMETCQEKLRTLSDSSSSPTDLRSTSEKLFSVEDWPESQVDTNGRLMGCADKRHGSNGGSDDARTSSGSSQGFHARVKIQTTAGFETDRVRDS